MNPNADPDPERDDNTDVSASASPSAMLRRRDFLVAAGAVAGVAAAAGAGKVLRGEQKSAEVFIAKAATYESDLTKIIGEGLMELGLDLSFAKGKSILLKPNLVEPSRKAPHINTHPKFVRAVIEVFRQWDAREVFVAEGQGHCRDTDYVLEQSGLGEILDEAKVDFVDLNHDDVFEKTNALGATRLETLYLPASLKRADVVVSLPKMKTHHWAGVTLSMKNLFGVMPGVCYGWPKNVLHYEGIPRSILDIAAAVKPHLAIVDGIIGMEGDGPIMGQPKPVGVIVMGRDLPAVDATTARLMELDPYRIWYLAQAENRLGAVNESRIQQRGETIVSMRKRFALLNHPSMREFRDE